MPMVEIEQLDDTWRELIERVREVLCWAASEGNEQAESVLSDDLPALITQVVLMRGHMT